MKIFGFGDHMPDVVLSTSKLNGSYDKFLTQITNSQYSRSEITATATDLDLICGVSHSNVSPEQKITNITSQTKSSVKQDCESSMDDQNIDFNSNNSMVAHSSQNEIKSPRNDNHTQSLAPIEQDTNFTYSQFLDTLIDERLNRLSTLTVDQKLAHAHTLKPTSCFYIPPKPGANFGMHAPHNLSQTAAKNSRSTQYILFTIRPEHMSHKIFEFGEQLANLKHIKDNNTRCYDVAQLHDNQYVAHQMTILIRRTPNSGYPTANDFVRQVTLKWRSFFSKDNKKANPPPGVLVWSGVHYDNAPLLQSYLRVHSWYRSITIA